MFSMPRTSPRKYVPITACQSGSTRRMYSGSHASMSLPSSVRRRWSRSLVAISPHATAPSTARPTAKSVDSSSDIWPPSSPCARVLRAPKLILPSLRAVPDDAAEAIEGEVCHRRGDRADPVRDESEREAEVRVGPPAGPAVAVVAECACRLLAGRERVVVAQPPAHAHAEDLVAGAHLHAADLADGVLGQQPRTVVGAAVGERPVQPRECGGAEGAVYGGHL